jgi:hypothetical protein
MRARAYPLNPLASFRDRRVEDATGELERTARAREAAEAARAEAERADEQHRRATAAVSAAERDALARGELRVADLAAADAWSLRARIEQTARAARAHTAQASEVQAKAAEHDARARLSRCKADADVVHEHRARFDDTQRWAVEAFEEEASSEAWRPKR